jgi:hypothetical protein
VAAAVAVMALLKTTLVVAAPVVVALLKTTLVVVATVVAAGVLSPLHLSRFVGQLCVCFSRSKHWDFASTKSSGRGS